MQPSASAPVRCGLMARSAPLALLRDAGRVTVLSAPPGSGKTMVLRSWIATDDLAGRVAWVSAPRDAQRFWISIADALRGTAAGSALVRPLTPALGLDGWAVVERLLADLAPLREPVWLIIDDMQDLAADALHQVEQVVLRAPPDLRLVLASRHDMRLGLHRLRLEGELTEIRAADLRFTVAEARDLLTGAGVRLSDAALARLHEQTEGWAAGLRLAALSLAGCPDPERSADQFSGGERTVAEYLLAEVLDRQDERARRLLLRTSVLDRVNGELADLLTGGSGGEQILHDLERGGAFVVSLDAYGSWFRYHRLFAELLRRELRRTARDDIPALHAAAATWLVEHDCPAEAVRHMHELPQAPMLPEPLTGSEARVLHYLPTHLTAAEIAQQLHLSVHTVTTHLRHLYAKLGAHRRHEAVDQARALGLLT
ncbi:hypothetical protein HH310_06435 [Actinoplanes sp. TBRC 11911]|uniref:helix-turn-helix transcriptional regulator n=1 Tax=Actinoplanes sp. TBRC 11911 TaxID=2729386 RepID=UPI00145E8A52|nr:LuxR family transcriptional regulator [Actinoplanes sp. TBRC 11911]NMO50829.1 hypothetical protein [Actinoplanes sp. TBRC 11911]